MFLDVFIAIATGVGVVIAWRAFRTRKKANDGSALVDVDPSSHLATLLKQREKERDTAKSFRGEVGHFSARKAAEDHAFGEPERKPLDTPQVSSHTFGSDEYFADFIDGLKKKENSDEISISIEDHD